MFFQNIASSKYFRILFYILLFLFIFSYNFTLPRDPDFGWHLRYGEETWEKKVILLKDTFSHSFFGQEVIDTEWLIETIYYLLFKHFSFFGVSFFSALFTSLAFFVPVFFLGGELVFKFLFSLWVLLALYGVFMVGARPQNLSAVFFSLLVVLLLKYEERKNLKYLIFLPGLFLIWANAHPAFPLGLIFFFIYLFLELILFIPPSSWLKKKSLSFFLVFILGVLATTIRPKASFSGGFSLDLIKGLALPVNIASESSLTGRVRLSIAEWLPPIFTSLSGALFFLSFVFSVAIFTLGKISRQRLRYLILILFFIYFSLLSRRNMPFFLFVFLPFMLLTSKEMIKFSPKSVPLSLLNFLSIGILLFWTPWRLVARTKDVIENGRNLTTYCQAVRYPCAAIEFIKKNRPEGNMFNHYDWGG